MGEGEGVEFGVDGGLEGPGDVGVEGGQAFAQFGDLGV